MTSINMLAGKAGDKVKIDDKLITLQNSYKLITNINNIKYYEIETNNKIKFKINEEYLLKIINVKINDANYYNKWFTKDKKIYCNYYALIIFKILELNLIRFSINICIYNIN